MTDWSSKPYPPALGLASIPMPSMSRNAIRLALSHWEPSRVVWSERHLANVALLMYRLGSSGVTAAVVDRRTQSILHLYIPGPGELPEYISTYIGEQASPEWIPQTWVGVDNPPDKSREFLLFNDTTGLSSCRDYLLLYEVCHECGEKIKGTATDCAECNARSV